MIRRGRDHLIFRALLVLDEAVSVCRDAPIQPSLGQRFALMFLFAVSDGDRRPYDGFWHSMQDGLDTYSEHMSRTMRETNARTFLTGIARSVGVEFSAHYQRELGIARMPEDHRRAYRQEEARLAEHRRRLREDGWQYEADDRAKADGRAVAAGECPLTET
jgi:hypothetical protein